MDKPDSSLISRERMLLTILGFFMMMAPASTDMYLPALVAMRREMHASEADTQLTLSFFFLGFALGQLLWGALSDSMGRRKPMIAGLSLYIVGSIGCAYASNVHQMIGWRFLEAFGGCAMPVIAQAIVRDLYGAERSAKPLSIMLLVMSVAPIAAPFIGTKVLLVSDWRAVFWLLAAFGGLAFFALLLLPETLERKYREATTIRGVTSSYMHLLRDYRSMGYIITGGATYGAMFTYITGAPLVYMEYFGLSPKVFGLLFGVNFFGMAIMSILNSRIVTRIGADRLLRFGIAGCSFSTVTLATLQHSGASTLLSVIVILFCFMSTRTLVTANAIAGALANHPERAGVASALGGSMQFAFGFLVGPALGMLGDGTPWAMTFLMAALSLLALLTTVTLLR